MVELRLRSTRRRPFPAGSSEASADRPKPSSWFRAQAPRLTSSPAPDHRPDAGPTSRAAATSVMPTAHAGMLRAGSAAPRTDPTAGRGDSGCSSRTQRGHGQGSYAVGDELFHRDGESERTRAGTSDVEGDRDEKGAESEPRSAAPSVATTSPLTNGPPSPTPSHSRSTSVACPSGEPDTPSTGLEAADRAAVVAPSMQACRGATQRRRSLMRTRSGIH